MAIATPLDRVYWQQKPASLWRSLSAIALSKLIGLTLMAPETGFLRESAGHNEVFS
ncbi:hypothetical protein PN499_05495 [Kamptonema animale CS-326]|uniref:hypothetical protein n=1 Tax=Kamptonema animale TaxID=92934 RepID=UPI002330369D|nr:hypothetical protein [Kamptonema animale]MDB9510630.1 hypothetical protein [Kamptonema animale CS-326]